MKEDVQHPHGTLQRLAGITSRPFRTFAKYTKGAQHHFTFQTPLKMNEHEDGHLKAINSKGFPFLYGVHGEVLCSFLWWTEHMYYTVYNIKGMGLEHQDKSNLRCIWVDTSCHLKSTNNSGYLNHTACEHQVLISPKIKIKSSKIYLQNTVIRVQESWTQVEKEQSCKQTSCNKNDSWSLVVPHPCLLFHVC